MSLKFIYFSLLLLSDILQYSSTECEITYRIFEEEPSDTFVGNLSAYLPEEKKDSKFKFSPGDDKYAKFFRIDGASGKLMTAQPFDRDQEEWCDNEIECELDMKLLILSSAGKFVDICQLKIIVMDINDNAPYFDSAIMSREIVESLNVNSLIDIMGANDKDAGVNAVNFYELLNGHDKFALEIDASGRLLGLFLKSPLDREKEDFYNLTLIAKDNGIPQRSGSVILNLKVKDINDNRPLFTKESYNVNVDENTPISSVILTLIANDADSGQNGLVGYRFPFNAKTSIKNIFSIEEDTGKIILKKNIDYEKKTKYSFEVVGFDHGSQSHQSTVLVNINVVNINDNKPDIFILHVSKNVSESGKIGDTIARISVSDKDDNQKNAADCSIDNPYFKLDSNLNRIMIKKELDFEKIKRHNVSILCHDHGEPQLQSIESFLVHVHDENDNPPVFKNPHIVSQLENHDFKAFKFLADDRDSGENSHVYYTLSNDSVSLLFNISHQDGLITTDVKFDREKNPELEFKVIGIDMGKPPLTGTGTVILRLLDVNDEAPTFGKDHYEFHVKEGQSSSTFIGKVEAQDLDIEENGQIYYWIPNHNESSEYFEIDQGNLIAKRTLTYSKNLKYDFEIFASDRGVPPLFSSTNVTIFVDDINDNVPYFVYPTSKNNSISIIYDMTSTNKPIAQIIARDEDEGENAKLSYFLKESPGSPDLFRINISSGEIMLVKNKKVKVQNEPIGLSIIVRDHGEPNLENSSILFVTVDFGNQTWPVTNIVVNYLDEANRKIGLILGIVTACLIVCVIAVICIVRKIDDSRRHYPARKLEDVAMKKSLNRTQCSQISLSIRKTPETTDTCSIRLRERMGSETSECKGEEKEIDECLNNNNTEKKKRPLSQIHSQGGSCAALL